MVAERRLMSRTLDDLKKKKLKEKRKWIRDARVILSRFHEEQETHKEVQLFREYFGQKRARYDVGTVTSDITKDCG